jgi:hypothetical protein
LALALSVLVAMGMSSGTCRVDGTAAQGNPNAVSAGLWRLARGDLKVLVSWDGDAAGQVEAQSASGKLEPLEGMKFPPDVQPLIAQWNAGLEDLNARLDIALPTLVWVSFPKYAVMRLTDADAPARTGEGSINNKGEYFFLGDLSGGQPGSDQGAGTTLEASTIRGGFDTDGRSTRGDVARTLTMTLQANSTSGIRTCTAQIIASYTGTWSGQAPDSKPAG